MLAELIAACALAADPGLVVTPLGPVRPDGLLRVAIHLDNVPAVPVQLDASLVDGGEPFAGTSAQLATGGAAEAILVLTVNRAGGGNTRVRATASWSEPGRPRRQLVAEAPVATPGAVLAATTATVVRLRASGRSDPLPWLWAEQISELGAGGASAASVGEVASLGARIAAWLDQPQPVVATPGRNELALRDPVDGSVQPLHLHLPAGAGPFPVLVVMPGATPTRGKARWAGADARLISDAISAGLAVVVCYPAGDAAWAGAARRRIPLALAAAAAAASLDLARGAIIGSTTPGGLPFVVHTPPVRSDTAWYHSLPAPARPVAPGDGWADAPFTIVVGTAEHAAAVQSNCTLAESLRAAYTAHAHAVVELVDDRIAVESLAGRNLVLVGNPRSNRVLAALKPELPFRWDHRSVVGADGVAVLRARKPPLVARVRTADGRVLLVLDGPPPAWGPGLPLSSY